MASPIRIARLFRKQAQAKDLAELLKQIEKDGKEAASAQKRLPDLWRRDADLALQRVLKANKHGKELEIDARAVHSELVDCITTLGKEWSLKASEEVGRATLAAKHEEDYWDAESVADGQEISHPLGSFEALAWTIQSDFKRLWDKIAEEYHPGELNKILNKVLPPALQKEGHDLSKRFFLQLYSGSMTEAFRTLWAGIRNLSKQV